MSKSICALCGKELGFLENCPCWRYEKSYEDMLLEELRRGYVVKMRENSFAPKYIIKQGTHN